MPYELCRILDIRMKYIPPLRIVISELRAAYQSRTVIESLTAVPYDPQCPQHVEKLHALWTDLLPLLPVPTVDAVGTNAQNWAPSPTDSELPPGVSSSWSFIGFQSDPSRDFRGMGMLGLDCLCHFTSRHTERARDVLREANCSGLWLPFAATGLNITLWLTELLSRDRLNPFFYRNERDTPQDIFGVIYSYFFLEFSRFWRLARPSDIMQFGTVSGKFRSKMDEILNDIRRETHGSWAPTTATGSDLIDELRSWIEGEVPADNRNKYCSIDGVKFSTC
eukprot:GHVO01032502.1.p1 GENE.GHVO01032502.1~~GHVO01032502.1.p1  ORF type:complete len:279 (-),score=42.82 GHVO01032502.1:361-1197(-)